MHLVTALVVGALHLAAMAAGPSSLGGTSVGSGATAQTEALRPPPLFSERMDVEIVNVEVFVRDRSGKPVRGLPAESFRLYEDGREVEITNHFEVAGGRRIVGEAGGVDAGASGPAPVTPSEPLQLVVYVDNAHIAPFSRLRLFRQLRDLLRQRLREGDRVMLASFGGTVEILQPFTREWKPLQKAIEELQAAPAPGLHWEAKGRRVLEEVLDLGDYYRETFLQTPCPPDLVPILDSHAQAVYGHAKASLEAFSGFAESLGGLAGRKALLFVSDGLPQQPGLELYEFLAAYCNGTAVTEGIPDAFDVSSDGGTASLRPEFLVFDAQKYTVQPLLDEVAERANASGVTLYSLEARGPRPSASTDASVDDRRIAFAKRVQTTQRMNLQDPLHFLAAETGGQAILDTIDFAPRLEKIAGDFDAYYSLGYRARREGGEARRRLRVEVEGEGLEVRHRQAYVAKSADQQLAERTLGTLLFEQQDNPLGVELRLGELTTLDGSLHMVPVLLRVPLGRITLLPVGDDAVEGRLKLYVGARDRTGRMTPVRAAEVPIRIPQDRLGEAQEKFYVYEVKMLMREGDHAVAVGVRDELGAESSYVRREVPVEGR